MFIFLLIAHFLLTCDIDFLGKSEATTTTTPSYPRREYHVEAASDVNRTEFLAASSWGRWSKCSRSCGTGWQERSEDCRVSPCNDRRMETKACVLTICNDGFFCNFESDCAFLKTDNISQSTWIRGGPTTSTSGTGPRGDHTNWDKPGKFLYIDAGFQEFTATVQIYPPVISIFSAYCLSFWYHMYGDDIGVLEVILNINQTNTNVTLFHITGDQGRNWFENEERISVTFGRSFSVMFKAISTGRPRGDIALDDISLKPCVNAWSAWHAEPCSVTCGTGLSVMTRRCVSGTSCRGISKRITKCSQTTCSGVWNQWSSWICSVTCGVGAAKRTRICQGRGCQGKATEGRPCRIPNSCPVWSGWRHGPCSVTCGGGSIIKRRRCLNGSTCKGESTLRQTCNRQLCPVWTAWRHGTCSVSCGTGRLISQRECLHGNICQGVNTRSRTCYPRICPGLWTGWSRWTCSVTCDLGIAARTRSCPGGGCQGNNREQRECGTPDSCPVIWSVWSEWTLCPQCGLHLRSRYRRCLSGRCSDYTTQWDSCKSNPCASWSAWRNLSCDVTCGVGIHTQTRECRDGPCNGPRERRNICRRPACIGTYGPWSTWSGCTATCGGGQKKRVRACSAPRCVGSNTDVASCSITDC